MSTRHNTEYYLRHRVTYLERVYLVFSYWVRKSIILSNMSSQKKYDILDIGCGEGEFLRSLPISSFNKIGIDMHKPGSTSDFKFLLGKLELVKFKEHFDIITANHVVEHLDDGQKFFKRASALLKPNGLMCISTPNKGSFGYWFAKNKWYHFDYPHHNHLYDAKSLESSLRSSGFSIVKIFGEFPGFPFDFLHTLKNIGPFYLFLAPIFVLFKFFIPETIMAICKK